MALSAADLQKRHELEGAPDPFPSLVDSTPTRSKARPATTVDTDSEAAFPSLAPAAPSPVPASTTAWGPRIKAAASRTPVFTDSFNLSAIELPSSGKEGGKTATLGEVMKQVMAKYKVKLEASGNQKARQTTFHIKAESEKELDKAKRSLLALLSPVITLVINAPVSTIGSIVGPKGATLKQIRDQTSVRVDIPKRESINGHASEPSSDKASPDDEDEEPTVPVTLVGPQPLAYEAQALLNKIISSKTSKATQRVRDIPAHILPFVTARRALFLAAAEGGNVNLSLNQSDREITASGDREAVIRVVDTIKSTVEDFKTSLTSIKISLPKRQHRLLVGKAVEEILAKSKCSVVVPGHEEAGEEVTVWGQAADLPTGLSAVMERANSKYIHEFPLPGPIAMSRQLLTYFVRIQLPKTLTTEHPGVNVFFPSSLAAEKASNINIDIVGDKPDVDAVVSKISALIGKLIGATRDVTIDWLLHRVITGKNAKKLKQFHDVHNVQVFFPQESAESNTVLLVYDPTSPSASPIPDEKKKHLEDVEAELLKMAKEAGDVKSETITVEKRWHEAVVGQGGTTLNAIIGEDKTLSIKVGAEAGDSSTEDVILIRGASSDVDRAVKEILKIVEDAKNDEIINSFVTDFDIDREYVGRIVGSQGAGINKLRDQLGVRVDVSDEEDKEKEGGKKKKTTHLKARVRITGRKENVEEARRRILAQVERLADETSEVLKIPSQYHPSLIGQNGKYAIRLEEKYAVKITFPRSSDTSENKTRENLKSDEVLIKGGKKGVAGAKSELLDAVEFEKESNNVLTFTVPTRSVARILGRGGATINEIKMNTDAYVDIDNSPEDAGITNILLRGSKKSIAAAKAAILAIAEQVGEETTMTMTIENEFHRALIGPGGKGLKEIISLCGGPSDPRVQAGLIRFPRQGEPSDEVRLRGEPGLVKKLKAELEKAVGILRDRVVLGVEIPASQHRTFIGRGGQNLNELQDKFGVQIQFPGSRSYKQFGEPENVFNLEDVAAENLVKVGGSRSAVEDTIEALKGQVKPPAAEEVTSTIEVPLKYHHVISQQGNFFRSLRNYGVHVDHSAVPQKSAVPPRPSHEASPARIDEAEESTHSVEWEVISNYQGAEEGESTWTIKARDQAGLERAEQQIKHSINHAKQMTHVGYLTLSDRSSFPRIVGTKGANVARLREESGADITVSKENNTITIMGSEANINTAKESILRMAANTGRPRHRQQD